MFIDQDTACPLDGDASANSALSDREHSWLLEHRDTVIKLLHQQILNSQERTIANSPFYLFLCLVIRVINPISGHLVRITKRVGWRRAYIAFRHQFKLSKHELQGLRRIELFTVTIYIRMWVTAHVSMFAPSSDLLLLQILEQYAHVDHQISQEGTHKMRGQL